MQEVRFRGKRLRDKQWVIGDLIENQGRLMFMSLV